MDPEVELYNHESVKKLCYQMFDEHCRGLLVHDFGNIQYKYLEMWGVIDLDDWKTFERSAGALEASNELIKMKKSRKEEIESMAKLLFVRDFYQRISQSGQHIRDFINGC